MSSFRRNRSYFACIFSVLAAAGACGGSDLPSCPAAATLGTGTVDFEPLGPDPELALIAGTQGGHHVVVHAQARGIAPGDPSMVGIPENPRTLYNMFDEAGAQIDYMPPPYTRGYQVIGDCAYEMPSGSILRVLDERVDSIRGQTVRITLQVTDRNGTTATDERWIRIAAEAGLDGGTSDAGAADAGSSDAGP